jgi:hypothetical protein
MMMGIYMKSVVTLKLISSWSQLIIKPTELPLCVMTFAYGNPKILEQKKLMNSQNGEYLDVDIQFLREESHMVKGKEILTSLWQIEAKGR